MARKEKRAKELTKLIEEAGGRWELTANGHLRVYGPKGMGFIGRDAPTPRQLRNQLAQLRRYTGLDLR